MLLVLSEYLFLHEVFDAKRLPLIAASVVGIIIAAVFLAFFFIRYRKATDEHRQ